MSKPTSECRGKAQKYVEDRFPDMARVRPRVTTDNVDGKIRHRFTFRKALRSPNGGQFQQIIRLTTDEEGKVLKVSVSR
jgi:hypothetical protein